MKRISRSPLLRTLLLLTVFQVVAVALNLAAARPAQAQAVADYFEISYSITGLSMAQVTGDQTFTVRVMGQAVTKKGLPVSEAVITGQIVGQNTSTGAEVILNPSYVVNIAPFPSGVGESYTIDQTVGLKFPPGSSSGNYNLVGKLLQAKVKAVFWIDVTSFLPRTQSAGTVNYAASVPVIMAGGGGSGGGGGGIAASPPVQTAPPKVLSILVFGKPQDWQINDDGGIKQDTRVSSPNGRVDLLLKAGARVLDRSGASLQSISIDEEKSPRPPPADSSIIGNPYDIGPSGAQFQPYLELTLSYTKPLPPGLSENDLKLAYSDENEGKWVLLESQVDSLANAVTARVSHFTTFAIIGRATPPASFSTSNLTMSPKAVRPGEKVTISVEVNNTGGREGNHNLQLLINGTVAQSRDITLAPGIKGNIAFQVVAEQPGIYGVGVGGLSGDFSVIAPTVFTLSDMAISPLEAKPGEKVEISATASNRGESQGTYRLDLVVDGSVLQSKEVTLTPGSSERVSFSVARDKAGSYDVRLGELSGSFVMLAPPSGPPAFDLTSLFIIPAQAKTGEKVTISANASNRGGSQGTYRVDLVVNDLVLQSKEVSLPAGSSERVSFLVAMDKAGSYSVRLDDLSGAFVITAPPPAPPTLALSSLSIIPPTARPGEKVTIAVDVNNRGGSQGTHKLDLVVNGSTLQSKDISLPAGSSERASFVVVMDNPGSYSVRLGELSGSFVISALRPAPPVFAVTSLSIDPAMARPGEKVTISVDVNNRGGSQDTYKLDLVVNGSILQSRQVSLPAGSTERVSFSVVMDNPGSYSVGLGGLSDSLIVKKRPAIEFWFMIGAIFVAISAAYLILRRRVPRARA